MRDVRLLWALIGVAAAACGAGVSELVAGTLTLRNGPVSGFADAVAAVLPAEFVVHSGIDLVALLTGPLINILLLLALVGLAAAVGAASAFELRRPLILAGVIAAIGLLSAVVRPTPTLVDMLPVLAGTLAFLVVLILLRTLARRCGLPRPPEPVEVSERVRPRRAPSYRVRRVPATGTDPDAPWAGSESEAGTTEDDAAGTDAPGTDAPGADAPGTDAPEPLVPAVTRRVVLGATVFGIALGAAAALAGDMLGRTRRAVEESRRLLRLSMVSAPQQPADVGVGIEGVAPWITPNEDFYRHDEAVVVPAIAAEEWVLRIHGEVEREIEIGYEELIDLAVSEQWITLVGLTYEPGGDQVGNAWWSGIPTHLLLERAGVSTGADVVVQTGDDGWQCVTSTQVLGDPERRALLAFAMNGEALPLEHGFPARTIVPGLYGGVSACKWVVDWEVTRTEAVLETWDADRPLRAPVRIGARIDTPENGDEVEAGIVEVGGLAWAPTVGVGAVEVSVDDQGWGLGVLADATNTDSWAQWGANLELGPGRHTIRVRSRDRAGTEQEEDLPEEEQGTGAVGYHEIEIDVVGSDGE